MASQWLQYMTGSRLLPGCRLPGIPSAYFISALSLCLMFLMSSPAIAAIYIVGTCTGATHSDFATAYNQINTAGPHTLRLCPGTHVTSAVTANWRHTGIIIESVSGTQSDTILQASSTTLMTTTHQYFTLRNVGIIGDISVGNSGTAFRFEGVHVSGNISAGSSTLIFEDSHLCWKYHIVWRCHQPVRWQRCR